MCTELCQPVALVTHGNAWLHADRSDAPPELLRSSPLFQFVASLHFEVAGQEIGTETAAWFRYLKREQASGLRLILGPYPAWVTSALRDGREWAIQVTYPRWWEIWKGWWHSDQSLKAWRITYSALRLDKPLSENTPRLKAAAAALMIAAAAAEQVSRKMGSDPFTKMLIATQQALESSAPEPDWFAGMLPSVPHNPQARQLLVAAEKAWVFGGMGSWLDRSYYLGAATQEEFNTVHQQLWDAVVSAVAAATNAYLPHE